MAVSTETTGQPDSDHGRDGDGLRLPRRSTTNRYLAGVAGGIADRAAVDPMLVRVGLVVAALFTPLVVVAYTVAWLVLPEGGRPPLVARPRAPGALRTIIAALALGAAGLILLPDLRPGGSPAVQLGVALVSAGLVLLRRTPSPAPDADGPSGSGAPPAPSPQRESGPPSVALRPARPHAPWRPRPLQPLSLLAVSTAALVVGIAGAAVAAGAEVSPGAVLSAVLALFGVALVVSAVYGRARGLILVAAAIAPLWAAFSLTDIPRYGGVGTRRWAPGSVPGLQPAYRHGLGDLEVDLTGLDLEPGDEIAVEIGLTAGVASVRVPAEAEVVIDGQVGLGEVEVWHDAFGYRLSDSGPQVNRQLHRVVHRPVQPPCHPVPSAEQGIPTTTAPLDPGAPSQPTTPPAARPPVYRDPYGRPCAPRPPPEEPVRINVDIAVGVGRLEVHRVPTST